MTGDGNVALYECQDGTPFPVVWEDPADAELTWVMDLAHRPRPAPPMEISARRLGQAAFNRCFEEVGAGVPVHWAGEVYANYWAFSRPSDPPQYLAANHKQLATLVREQGGSLAVWEDRCLPLARDCYARLSAAPDTARLGDLCAEAFYARGQTQVAAMALAFSMRPLQAFLNEEIGAEGASLFLELAQGYPNETLAADEELWQLAQLAGRTPALRGALTSEVIASPTDIAKVDHEREFSPRFDAFITTYGPRGQGWQLMWETWEERPDIPLATIRRLIETGAPSPMASLGRAAERRQALLAELCARLRDAAKAARLRELAAGAACYVPVREGRAMWQLISYGGLRLALLRVGRRLVREGHIDSPEDFLFLYAEEAEDRDAATFRDLVAQRRAEYGHWARILPPEFIGKAPPVGQPQTPLGTELRGIAASRGRVTARARLLDNPSQAARLGPGEVLVCLMTAPPWTSLFSIAGAVVTEGGGILSHPSIAAREYGIPCVVGVRGAMARIRDGELITVDGTTGIVQLPD